MKFAIATIYTEDIKDLAAITVEQNKRKYCEKHGYDLRVKTEGFVLKNLGFEKIRYVLELLKSGTYDWVYWCGADTMITNYNIKLESLMDPNYHFVISTDIWDFNSDSFLIRNSTEGIEFFEHILRMHDTYIDKDGKLLDFGIKLPDGSSRAWAEQGAMCDLKERYKEIIKINPQKVMNSYLYKIYPSAWHQKGLDCNGNDGTWSDGDFLVHWPGVPHSHRLILAADFIKRVRE